MASNLRQRAVVSSFICTSPQSPSGLTFALFKRSQDVSTYPGKWAVCSGSIDATDSSPEFAAKREISEETTLNDNDITLLRRGKPFSLIDEKLKTEWTIHPFAWQLKPDAKPIKFDWEHTEYHFVKPKNLGNYDHVPQLEIGMNRVLVSDETEEGLKILRDDHESGAHALAVKALGILLGFVQGEEMAKLGTSREFWQEVRWRAWHLAKNGRPSMGAAIEAELFKVLDSAYKNLEGSRNGKIASVPLETVKSAVESAIEGRISGRQQSLEALANNFVKFVGSNWPFEGGDVRKLYHIVTLSSSGTITQCLRTLLEHVAKTDIKIKLSILESRPKFEGVSFVNTLLEPYRKDRSVLAHVKIDIVSDASIASVFEDEDERQSYYLVLGADRVYSNGDVSNKIGSLAAAAIAQALDVDCKVVAVFDSGKVGHVADRWQHPTTEYNDPAELMGAWPSDAVKRLKENQAHGFKIEVKNAYFEWVSLKYIDRYITEEGIMDLHDLERSSGKIGELEERLFGDL